MKRVQKKLLAILSIILLNTSSAFAESTTGTSVPFGELISQVVNEASSELNKNLQDKEQFKAEFKDFKEKTDAKLEIVLSDITGIIKNYAETEDLQESSEKLFKDFSKLLDELNQIVVKFPRYNEVEKIISPISKEFEETLISQFPKIEPAAPEAGPLGGLYNFYTKTEQENPFGLGPFFRIPFIENLLKLRTFVEKKHEYTIAGVKGQRILFSETNEYEGGKLVFHEKIVNGTVTEEFRILQDLSIFHGLPGQMRRDGVDERYVRFVEEYLNLINYHLVKNHNELGLIVDVNHPQIHVPDGYTPDKFVANFVQILISLTMT
ncbi:MAG: hypothetical protein KBD53_04140 [Candidatus Omnitrophica bacterium]|nr:hypothetical protein [Candidatus Omnitrophota bacterium]